MKTCQYQEMQPRLSKDGLQVFDTHQNSLILVDQGFYPRPHLHPLRPLDGKGVLTQDAPAHHPWQHGIYCGLHHVGESDFWFDARQRPHAGRIETVACEVSGPQRWTVSSHWLAHDDGRALLHERQEWTIHGVCDTAGKPTWCLRLRWTLCARERFSIAAHDYGGPFVRMPFQEGCAATARNAKGDCHRDCDKQDSDWLGIAMDIEGRDTQAGFLVSYHPDSVGSRRWRLDNQYGCGPVVVTEPMVCEPGWSRTWQFGFTCLPRGLDHDLGALHQAYISSLSISI